MENQENRAAGQDYDLQPSAPNAKKYGVIQSLRDFSNAVKRKPATFIGSVATAYILSILAAALFVAVLAGSLMAGNAMGPSAMLFASPGQTILLLIVSLLLYTVLFALAYAFILSCTALPLSSSVDSIGGTLKKALSVTVRVAKVNVLVVIFAYWPFLLVASLPLVLFSVNTGSPAILGIVPLLMIAALIWAIIVHLRLALAPYIAIFEPEVPVRQTLQKSSTILKKGGQWFIVKGFLLVLAIIILLGAATGSNLRELQNSGSIFVNVVLLVVSILVVGAMTMLYFNRTGNATRRAV